MEAKHTKGEWKQKGNHVWSINPLPTEVKGKALIAICDNSMLNAEANAKLIAAAPELLEALIELYDSLPDGYESISLPKVRNAIKKATE
ncbi:MAG: hypothetical protein WCK78_04410 [Paludibacter sp.]